MGEVRASGPSFRDKAHPNKIYLVDGDGKPIETYYKVFAGRVSTPQGEKSITHHSECAPEGTYFHFEFRLVTKRISQERIAEIFAAGQVIGTGSVRSMERGKFEVERLEVEA